METNCPICGAPLFQHNGRMKCKYFPIKCNYVRNIEEFNENDTFIIFDFETNGLGENSKVIEVAAIKIKNGKVIDVFNMDETITPEEKFIQIRKDEKYIHELQSEINKLKENNASSEEIKQAQEKLNNFLNNEAYKTSVLVYPEMNISARISDITGITNAILRGKPKEDIVIPAFLEFAKDVDFVMGHNIINFDLRVLKSTCRRLKIKMPFTVAIDTLHMARKIFPKGTIENHKQETLAKHFGIQYEAHRAYNDVAALYEIFKNLRGLSSEDFKESIN